MSDEQNSKFYQEILDVCLTSGCLMIEGGSEIYRVEDTMMRIARNAGVADPRVFATPTCVFMSLAGGDMSQMKQIRDRNINLELVDRVNELSREFAIKKLRCLNCGGRFWQLPVQRQLFHCGCKLLVPLP